MIITVLVVGYVGYKTVIFVPQDKKAVKLRFGKVVYKHGRPLIFEPGVHIIVPFTHSVEQVDSRERVIRLKTDTHSTFFVPYKCDKPGGMRVAASVTVIPVDIHAWRYRSEDVENRVTDICITELQGPITSADPFVILYNSTSFSTELYSQSCLQINEKLSLYGASLVATNVGMSDVSDGQPLADAVERLRPR